MYRRTLLLVSVVLMPSLVAVAQAPKPYLEAGGLLAMEGETFTGSDVRADIYAPDQWFVDTALAGFAGDGYVTTPNAGGTNGTWDNACELTYDIRFTTAGTYTIWLRRNVPSSSTNSVFVGLDGTQIGGTIDNANADYNQWIWANAGTVNVTAGDHTFNLRRRERGYSVDRILLTTDSALTPSGEGPAESGHVGAGAAESPQPDNGATDVPRDTILSWVPGPYAATHNVYFGTSLDDVNTASVADPLGVLASRGQDAGRFDPDALLAFGTTYYWRIDEVNAPPTSNTVFKGDVWSFTTEPFTYVVEDLNVTTSIPTSAGAQGPGRSIDGSGLTAGRHSIAEVDMWLGDASAGGPAWIQFDFGQVYKLHDMHLWNYNTVYESLVGFGLRNVTIEYATDADDWVVLGDFEIVQATGLPDYAGVTLDLGGIPARAVRLNLNTNWGGTNQKYGLGEARFSYLPVYAREPRPAPGSDNLDPAVVLSWRAGREAASHLVYVGTDPNAVADGSALIDSVTTSTYDLGALDLGTTYYWKIGEVNDAEVPSLWASAVWGFTTRPYNVIDDFESYTDDENQRIYLTWLDGFEIAANGSQVGHDNPPFAEPSIAHAGQSLPLYYTNTEGVTYSEAERVFGSARDWTANGADTLSLWFRGEPIGFLAASDSDLIMNGIGADIYSTADQGRFVYKQLSGNGTIVARVDHLDNVNAWAKAGVMIRQTLQPDSVWAYSLWAPGDGNRYRFQNRATTGGAGASDTATATAQQTTVDLPVWVKLERSGNRFNAFYATTEAPTTWMPSPINPQTIEMGNDVYVGLAVTSHTTTATTQAIFSNVTTTGNVTGPWQSVSLTVDQPAGNGLDRFYLSVEDNSGRKATVVHPNPYAVGLGAWTQWLVPLSDLSAAGVNIGSVKRLSIGVGDKTTPSRGVSGLLFIDDVGVGHPAPTP